MEYTAITKENIEGFKFTMIPEVAAAIKRGEDIGAIGLIDDSGEMPAAAGSIVGAAMDGAFHILSIYVEKKYRSHGYGSRLLELFEEHVEEYDLPISLDFLSTTYEHVGLEIFLLNRGYEELDPEYQMVRFFLSGFSETPTEDPADAPSRIMHYVDPEPDDADDGDEAPAPVTPASEDDFRICSFGEIPEESLRNASVMARDEDLPRPEGGLLSESVSRECSMGVMVGNELKGYATVELLSEKKVLISSVWCEAPGTQLEPMLLKLLSALKERFEPDTYIYLSVDSDPVGEFAGRFCGSPEFLSRVFIKYPDRMPVLSFTDPGKEL
ncbi:MAG: GNAT family N-acetyltransferase [Lachnospiraceae bacterium]|nr:GNAT family N-acetyltransferase [Lachnospiraceae bacterium]